MRTPDLERQAVLQFDLLEEKRVGSLTRTSRATLTVPRRLTTDFARHRMQQPGRSETKVDRPFKTLTMQIPQDAAIPPAKLSEYLLVFRRKSDKSRFLAQAGFTQDNPDALAEAIRSLIARHDAVIDRQDEYGTFYRVQGDLDGPDGSLEVITIWIQREIDSAYWFVTLKPVR